MGPASSEVPGSLYTPPIYKEDMDKLQWRDEVRIWVQTVKSIANGGDSKAKGIAASLGLTLYRSLSFNKKELVKKEIRTGELVLNPDVEIIDQDVIIEKILNIVAKDSTINSLKRIVRLNREVSLCIRKNGESLGKYVERFTGIAQTYLNLINASQDGPDSINFEIMLLSNAKIPAQTFSNIVSSLVSTSKVKDPAQSLDVVIAQDRANNLEKFISKAISKSPLDKSYTDTKIKVASESLAALKAAISFTNGKSKDFGLKEIINLSDAAEELQEAGIEYREINEQKKKSSAMMGHNNYGYQRRKFTDRGRFEPYIDNRESRGQGEESRKIFHEEGKNFNKFARFNNKHENSSYPEKRINEPGPEEVDDPPKRSFFR